MVDSQKFRHFFEYEEKHVAMNYQNQIKECTNESFSSADGQLDINSKITLTRGDVTIDLDQETEFTFGPWLVQRVSASLHLIKTDQSLSLVITPIDDRIDIEVSGNLEHSEGMLEEFSKLNVELIEKQSKKQLDRTTLMINGETVTPLTLYP